MTIIPGPVSGSTGSGSGTPQTTRTTTSSLYGEMWEYTSAPAGGLSSAVRPYTQLLTVMPGPPAPAPPMLPGEDQEVFISWGEASNFDELPPIEDTEADDFLDGASSSTTIKWPEDERDEEQKPGEHVWTEIDAVYETIRVYDPEDAEVWVAVTRRTTARFRGPNGIIARFEFRNPPPPPVPTT